MDKYFKRAKLLYTKAQSSAVGEFERQALLGKIDSLCYKYGFTYEDVENGVLSENEKVVMNYETIFTGGYSLCKTFAMWITCETLGLHSYNVDRNKPNLSSSVGTVCMTKEMLEHVDKAFFYTYEIADYASEEYIARIESNSKDAPRYKIKRDYMLGFLKTFNDDRAVGKLDDDLYIDNMRYIRGCIAEDISYVESKEQNDYKEMRQNFRILGVNLNEKVGKIDSRFYRAGLRDNMVSFRQR
jgi:hypothetical protein|nr:MAG TPA: hypothetical protein [Caudoviricetes sp.]